MKRKRITMSTKVMLNILKILIIFQAKILLSGLLVCMNEWFFSGVVEYGKRSRTQLASQRFFLLQLIIDHINLEIKELMFKAIAVPRFSDHLDEISLNSFWGLFSVHTLLVVLVIVSERT